MRAAVERHNDDESVDVLVAVRVKVTNSQAADQEQGYRLRVKMAPADGTYKIAKMDQVTVVTAGTRREANARPTERRPAPLASWRARAGALALDVLLGRRRDRRRWAAGLTTRSRLGWLWWVYVGRGGRRRPGDAGQPAACCPTITGWSLGRALFGIRVRTRATASRSGFLRGCCVRDLAHLLDTAALFVGWLWPLWDSPPPHVRRPVAAHRGSTCRRADGANARAPRRGAGRPRACCVRRAGPRTIWWSTGTSGRSTRPAQRDRRAGAADRRADAELRQRHREGRLRAGAVAGHRRLPPAADRAAAGGAEGAGATRTSTGRSAARCCRRQRTRRRCCWPCRGSAAPTPNDLRSSPRRCGWTSRSRAPGNGGWPTSTC